MAKVYKRERKKNNDIEKLEPETVSHNVKEGVFTKDYSNITISLEKKKPSNNIGDYSFLLYGEGKIGKTTLAAEFGETFIFAFEPGPKALSVHSSEVITEWELFLHYLDLMEKGQHKQFDVLCIDTGHVAYDKCLDFICRRDQISHPGKVKDYGASWKEVMLEFTNAHLRLSRLKKGFIVLSHDRVRERKDRSGNEYDRVEPCFSEAAELFYKSIIDVVGYYHVYGVDRYLQIHPQDSLIAGHRVDGRFKTTTGEDIFRIPMGNSSKEAYRNIKKAFNNRQKETYKNLQDDIEKI